MNLLAHTLYAMTLVSEEAPVQIDIAARLIMEDRKASRGPASQLHVADVDLK